MTTNHAAQTPAHWCVYTTPVGSCGVAWTHDGRLAGSQLPEASEAATRTRMQRRFGAAEAEPPLHVQAWMSRLRQVMAGQPDLLDDIALADDTLPPFHRCVWALARQIPPGQTRSYGELAIALDAPGAARAVGQALGANPFAPFVPCHRVLAAHGASGGFSAPGGRHTKLQLLELEGARFAASSQQPTLF